MCCAGTGFANFTRAQSFPEVKVSPVAFGDIEFDSARDGSYCPTCNFGQGNSRFNWTDSSGNLWLGHVDVQTGAFVPTIGKAELVDTSAAFWSDFGNGPEWAFSQQGSQLVYTRYVPGMPRTSDHAGAALATMTNGTWMAGFLPGAISRKSTAGIGNTVLPEASQDGADPAALVLYKNLATPPQMFTESVQPSGVSPTLTPFGAYADGIRERWIPGTHQLVFTGSAPPDASGIVYDQIFWYDADTGIVAQLTDDPTNKGAAFMFMAPDFADNYILFTVANQTSIQVFEQSGVNPDGSPMLTQVNTITSPDPAEPYMNSPEPFINCTPACTTYIFSTLAGSAAPRTNGLAVMTLNPAAPMFKILVPTGSAPARKRSDPEYFISANGPYLYYSRIIPATGTQPSRTEGQFYIDMQLGAPSGPCVGSSAEGGLIPGC
jgi:hypothetical protein